MATPRKSDGLSRKSRAKATTPEERENQLASLAYDLAEKQMEQGTASAMLIVHFLKQKTAEQKLKEEKLRKENLLLEARTEALGSMKKSEELYEDAIRAIREYQGQDVTDEDF